MIARHRQPRIERGVGILEDDLHVAAQRAQRLAVEPRDLGALEPDLAGTGLDQPQDAAAGRRLAAARFAHQPQCFAGSNVEADAIDGVHALEPRARRRPPSPQSACAGRAPTEEYRRS